MRRLPSLIQQPKLCADLEFSTHNEVASFTSLNYKLNPSLLHPLVNLFTITCLGTGRLIRQENTAASLPYTPLVQPHSLIYLGHFVG